MFQYPRNEMCGNKTYHIRFQSSLINQIKADYHELIRLWNMFQNGEKDVESGEGILEKIAWIKTSIKKIEDINRNDIEGKNWGEMERIDENIQSMESQIMRTIGMVGVTE